jgi:hypothetical protein
MDGWWGFGLGGGLGRGNGKAKCSCLGTWLFKGVIQVNLKYDLRFTWIILGFEMKNAKAKLPFGGDLAFWDFYFFICVIFESSNF